MPFDPDAFAAFKQKQLSAVGTPPGKTENQPTIGEQIAAVTKEELAKRAEYQKTPEANSMLTDIKQFGTGLKEGALRRDAPPDASLPERLGVGTTKYGPAIAGSVAANALLPGAGVLASAAGQFAGAGIGEATGLEASKLMGGNAPDTKTGIAASGIKTGLGAATMELGLGMASKVISELPEIASVFLKTPVESLKRAMSRMKEGVDIIPTGGPAAQLKVETKGTKILEAIQDITLAKRKSVGMRVDNALENLHNKTQGKALFDVEPLAKDAISMMKNELQTADPSVKKLMGADYEKLVGFINTLKNKPMKTAKTMITIRRELDALGDFSNAGVPKIESDSGQKVYKLLANNFREVIDGAGKVLNDTSLTQANHAFHEFANTYDEMKPLIGTKDQGGDALFKRFSQLETHFNSGGFRQDLLAKIGRDIPTLKPHMERLMDTIAGRSFTKHALGTPSGTTKDLLRIVVDPENIGKIIKMSQSKAVAMASKITPQTLRSIAIMASQPKAPPPMP